MLHVEGHWNCSGTTVGGDLRGFLLLSVSLLNFKFFAVDLCDYFICSIHGLSEINDS